MARVLGVAVQTDILVNVPIGTAPSRVAFFRPEDLVECRAVLSPTEPESLTVSVWRDDPRTTEIVLGRVLRVVHEGGTDDTEWDITQVEDASTHGVLTITATPIALRLARVVYVGTDAGTGAANPVWSGVELTATEWLDTLVIPTIAAAGIPFEIGTIDSTHRFTMDGEWNSVLEIIRAIAEPGRATAEFRLSPGGDYGYVIDLLDAIGGSATTARVRTAHNLIETKRQRSLIEVATRLVPHGSDDSVVTTTMSEHLWQIASVVSGTVLELEAPFGGDDPILYDDQLNGLYVAVLIPGTETFASQVVSDSVASTQRITVASTAGMTAGDWCRFYVGSGANGARLTSLTNPTAADHPADGGYGDRAQILDRPAIIADTNLVKNGMMRAWTTSTNPPDGWEGYAADTTDVVFSQELADGPSAEIPAYRVKLETGGGRVTVFGAFTGGTDANAVQGPAIAVRSPAAQPWNTSGRTYVATVWAKVISCPADVDSCINFYLHDADRSGAPKWEADEDGGIIGQWLRGSSPTLNTWERYESAALDLSGNNPSFTSLALNGRIRVTAEIATDEAVSTAQTAGTWQGRWNVATTYAANDYVSYSGTVYRCTTAPSTGNTPPGTDWTAVGVVPNRRAETGWEVLISAVTLAEAATPIADREGSGGTELWQSVNTVLPTRSSPIKGYDLTVADLAADDATTYSTLAFTPGGTVEVTDTDLELTTALRLVEYERDYLHPLASRIRVGQPADRLTKLVESGRVLTTSSLL